MSEKEDALKAVFGLVIFLFSLALGYFTARYLDKNSYFDYWTTLAIFAAAYIVVGMLVSRIYPISFGFLFSADILILHLLFENFGAWPDFVKAYVIGLLLCILYLVAYLRLPDQTPELEQAPPTA